LPGWGNCFNIVKNSVSGYVVFWGKACKLMAECDNVYSKRIGRRWGKTAALTTTLVAGRPPPSAVTRPNGAAPNQGQSRQIKVNQGESR